MFLSIELYVFRCKALKLDHFLYIQVFQHVLFGRFVFSDKKHYIGKNRRLTFSFFLQKELIGNFFRVWSRRRGGTTVLKISGFGTLVQGCLVSKAWAEWLNVLPAWKHWMDTALDAAAATRCIGFKSLKPAENNLDYMWFDEFFYQSCIVSVSGDSLRFILNICQTVNLTASLG